MWLRLRNVEGKSLSFPPPWEFQISLSLGTPRLLINLPRKWLSQYYQHALCLLMLTLITWLKNCLSDYSTVKLHFFSLSILLYFFGRKSLCGIDSEGIGSYIPPPWEPNYLCQLSENLHGKLVYSLTCIQSFIYISVDS